MKFSYIFLAICRIFQTPQSCLKSKMWTWTSWFNTHWTLFIMLQNIICQLTSNWFRIQMVLLTLQFLILRHWRSLPVHQNWWRERGSDFWWLLLVTVYCRYEQQSSFWLVWSSIHLSKKEVSKPVINLSLARKEVWIECPHLVNFAKERKAWTL